MSIAPADLLAAAIERAALITCDECYPDTDIVRLPCDVFEITTTHSCGMTDEVIYA